MSEHPEHDPEAARQLIRAILLEGDVVAHPEADTEVKAFAHEAQVEALRLRKEMGIRDRRHLLDAAALLDALFRPMYLGRPRAIDSRKKRGRPPKHKGAQYDEYADRRRVPFHHLVRLPANRKNALLTRFRVGSVFREDVYRFCLELRKNGTPRRGFRSEIKRLAALRSIRIPADTRLTELIDEFFNAIANYSM